MDIYRRLSTYTNRVHSCHEVDCLDAESDVSMHVKGDYTCSLQSADLAVQRSINVKS